MHTLNRELKVSSGKLFMGQTLMDLFLVISSISSYCLADKRLHLIALMCAFEPVNIKAYYYCYTILQL